MSMLAYEELRIRIRPIGTSRYLVTANGPATATEVIAVNGEPAAFRDQWDRLISAELGLAPMGEQHTVAQLRGLGRAVFRLLFGERTPGAGAGAGFDVGLGSGPGSGEAERAGCRGERRHPGGVGACVGLALERAQRMRPARGLRIRFDVPEELRDLPLETLCAPPGQPQQSLALNHGYSLVRSLPGGPLGQRLPEPADEPSLIRLLVACASPVGAGLPPLRPDAEVAALRQELPEVAVQTTVLERATRKSLEAALGAHSPLPTALLLIAHGTYDHELGKGVVALETEGGGVDHVPADLLSGILLKAPGLRLVTLNLCSGADSSLAEPFSGLAQALIGGGVPAVVAMRGRVSDLSAGQFSPELFKGLAANRSIDEAMGAARRRISHLPGHTAVEWATPALFLHESCRQGWLFKAREVRDDGGAVADPLREGADALRAFQSPVGHVDSAVLIGAARFQRDLGQWAQVQRTLRAETRQFEDEQRRLRAEAAFELAWGELEKLCSLLAAEREADAVVEQFASLRDALPGPPPACLSAEVERFGHLTGLAERARAAEGAGEWAEAIARYEELLTAAGPADRARLVPHAAAHLLAVLDDPGRVTPRDRRDFFRGAARLYRTYGPADPASTPGEKALATASFAAYEAQRKSRSRRKGLTRRLKEQKKKLRARAMRLAYRADLRRPLDPHLAVYGAYWNRGISCNPAAIHAKARELAPHIRGVWVVSSRHKSRVPAGVEYVVEGSRRYWQAMARATYLINNSSFPGGFTKRPGQVYLQTHHGTPLKKMGLDQRRYPAGTHGISFQKVLDHTDQWDFSLSANPHSTEVWERVYPSTSYQALEAGYPRNDVYFTAGDGEIARIREELGVADGRTVLLYAPTHRDYQKGFSPRIDLERFVRAIGPSYVVLVRAHYFYGADAGLRGHPQLVDVTGHARVEDLCLAADALVTDYSSLMFDYACLDRPIVTYAPDWQAYRLARGTYFDLLSGRAGETPGAVATTEDELAEVFLNGEWDSAEATALRKAFRARFCPYDDGGAADRVVRRLFLEGQAPRS
ncbi:hypothetical protein GCM10010449_79130 [Streptomyces rectiviolaceus]|uniref:CHAT domain-containing protein n=1 Tax=Streptomyces rectiviolaceus TaxID=332591 RepID=A0ABP6NIL0_9ACTN